MTEFQGSYTPPGGLPIKPAKVRDERLVTRRGKGFLKGEVLSVSLGTSVNIRNGLPHILYGEYAGCVLLPMVYMHAKFGVLKTVDAHWTGKVWKIALAKPAEACPDCDGEACSICGGEGALYIPSGNTFQDFCARPSHNRFVGSHQDDLEAFLAVRAICSFLSGKVYPLDPGPGDKEIRCPKCQAKKCPTCKGKGKTIPIVWVLKTHLHSMGQPIPVKPGNTSRVTIRTVSGRRR